MSNYDDDRTTTIEKPKTTILDLIDERVQENTEVEKRAEREQQSASRTESEPQSINKTEIEREVDRFDNSHTAVNLNSAYDAIDRATYYKAQNTVSTTQKRVDTVNNPFFGDPEVLSRMREKKKPTYRDVVEMPTEQPTLEIKADKAPDNTVSKTKSVSTRKIMWYSVGAVCIVLLLTLIICNIFSLGAVNREISDATSGIIVQEQELADLNGSITNESGQIPEGMENAGAGGSINVAPEVPTDITTSDNVFNKITDFFSYLFGR